jgi:hypothetical protein
MKSKVWKLVYTGLVVGALAAAAAAPPIFG